MTVRPFTATVLAALRALDHATAPRDRTVGPRRPAVMRMHPPTRPPRRSADSYESAVPPALRELAEGARPRPRARGVR